MLTTKTSFARAVSPDLDAPLPCLESPSASTFIHRLRNSRQVLPISPSPMVFGRDSTLEARRRSTGDITDKSALYSLPQKPIAEDSLNSSVQSRTSEQTVDFIDLDTWQAGGVSSKEQQVPKLYTTKIHEPKEIEMRSHLPQILAKEAGKKVHFNINHNDNGTNQAKSTHFDLDQFAKDNTRNEKPGHDTSSEDDRICSSAAEKYLSNDDGSSLKRHMGYANDEFRPFKRQKTSRHMGEIVELWVGEPYISISVHKNVLRDPSAYFRDAFKDADYNENGDLRLKLPGSRPEIIDLMMHWMYYDEVFISQKAIDMSYVYSRIQNLPETALPALVKLYLVGEEYSIPRLRNDIIDAIIGIDSPEPLIRMSTFIWTQTVPESKLRKLITRLIGCHYSVENLTRDISFINQELLRDLAVSAFRDRDLGRSRKDNIISLNRTFCKDFHTHSEESVGKCIDLKEYVIGEE